MNNGRDGMSCTLYGSSLVLYGGHPTDASLLWHLDLLTLEWRTEVTTGAVPPKPIAYHAATITEGTSFIMGGGCSVSQSAAAAQSSSSSSMIEPLTTVPYAALRPMVLRQLDLSTLTWSVVPAAGEVPTDRSHHTFTADGAVLYLIGGKPLTPHGVTSRQFDEFVEMGFFDVFCFSTRSGIWQRVRTRPDDPLPTPRLWGHCAVLTAGTTGGGGGDEGRKQLLLHGGLEMELVGPTTAAVPSAVPDGEFTEGSERHDGHDDRSTRLPSAHFNQSIYLTTCPELRPDGATVPEIEWGAFHPQPQSLQPTARALHCAVLLPSSSSTPVQPYDARCLYVLGGFTLTPAGTVRLLGDDFWRCETSTGLWRPTSHYRDVLPSGGTEGGGETTSTVYSRPLFAVYGATLVVLSDDWKAVRLFDGSTWSEMQCDGRQLRLHEPLISHHGASGDQGRSSLGDTDIESRQQDTPNRALLSPSPAAGGGVGPGVTGVGGDGGSGRSSRRRGASSAKVQAGPTMTPNNNSKKHPQSSALQHLPPAVRNATPVIRELLMELPVISIPLQDQKSWGQVYGEGPSLLPQEVVKLLEENSSYQRLMQWRPALLNETTTAERK